MSMDFPNRKPNRLTEYDYSQAKACFVTICTEKRRNLFWDVGAVIDRPLQEPKYTLYGKIVDEAIKNIPLHYPAVSVDKYVVMPNHVHLLLQINTDADGRPMVAPTISTIVQQMKGAASKRAGFSLWQKGFYDHVVRGYDDYLDVWQYIENNPAKWAEDEHFAK